MKLKKTRKNFILIMITIIAVVSAGMSFTIFLFSQEKNIAAFIVMLVATAWLTLFTQANER